MVFRWFSMFFHQSHYHSAIARRTFSHQHQSIDTHRIGDIPYDISRSHVHGWFIYPLSVISTIRDAYITSPIIISPFWLVLYPDLHPDFSWRRSSHFHKYTVVHSCTGCLLFLISLKYTINVVVIWSFIPN